MSKNLYKRAGIWWGYKTYKGKKYQFSLETTNLREAQKRLGEKIAELIATNWGEKPRRTFDEATDKFIEEHIPTLKPKSAKRYAVSLGWLAQQFDGVKLDEITTGRLYEFEQTRYRAGASKPTIRRDLACLSSLMTCAMTWEWIDVNPVPAYKKARVKKGLKESEPRTRYLDHDEERRLLAACSNKLMEAVVFAIYTGLRKEEQFSLQRHNIDMNRCEIIIDRLVSKNKKERRVPLLPPALEIARKRIRQLRSPYLFSAANGERLSERSNYMLKTLKAAAKRAGIKPLIWHDLRRTCGCRLLQDYWFDIYKVRDWLGHSSVAVTEKTYAFLRIDDLHDAASKSTTNLAADIVELIENRYKSNS